MVVQAVALRVESIPDADCGCSCFSYSGANGSRSHGEGTLLGTRNISTILVKNQATITLLIVLEESPGSVDAIPLLRD